MRGRILVASVFAAAFVPGGAALAADPTLPLSQVQPGMQCTGYSVFRGTAVESFGVEILDVVGAGATGGGSPRLLVRVSGERVDATGVGPGFSGSPVYCPGPDGTPANAGAISETIGEYGGHTVFATPIEQILGTPVDAPAPPASKAQRAKARRDRALLAQARPIATPITVRGLSAPVQRALSRAAARRGATVLQAPPLPVAAPAPQALVPGSALGVGMSSGDLAIGAVGTVAYVDGSSIWAFGHPFDGAGGRSLLLQDAYVAAIINNPLQTADGGGTYKLAGPVNDIGTITHDGFQAVAGRVGALPPTIPVRVYTRDDDRGIDGQMLVNVADETDVGNPIGISGLSFIAPLTISEAATQALGATPLRVSGRMCFQVVLAESPQPLRFCNRYVSDGTVSSFDGLVSNLVALGAGSDASGALGLFDTYKGSALHVKEVSARLSMTRAQGQAYMRSLTLPARIRPGDEVPVRLRVKLVRGPVRTLSFRWHVPRALPAGRRTITFEGSEPDGSDDLFSALTLIFGDEESSGDTEGPRSVKQLARSFRTFQRWDGITLKRFGTRVYKDPELRVGGTARTTVVVERRRR